MPEAAEADSVSESEWLDTAVDQVIAAHGGDMRSAIRTLVLIERDLERSVSQGFVRGVRHGRFNCYNG
ncbi:MAG: hypothetical protein J0G28_03520 [Afipia sp.]|nr:hypothetical protein [Afipia sp.]OJW61621.1 MAG: hypothetical protein BGO65_09510 [Afipia sp. 64-13]